MEQNMQFNRAKNWQLFCFGTLQAGANVFLLLMNFTNYLGSGMYGIAVITVSLLMTAMRLWDGITDPIIGWLLDHTNIKRFGRYRPIIVLGYIIATVSVLLMFYCGKGHGVIMFTVLNLTYYVGYTMMNITPKAAMPIITNDPKQRPLIGRYTAFMTLTLSTFFSTFMSKVLVPKFGGLTVPALQTLSLCAIALSGVCVILACLALGEKDKYENIKNLAKNSQPKMKDCWQVVKKNRNIQMVMVAAITDKVASMVSGNTSVAVMLFGILIGNYAFKGNMSLIAYVPTLFGIVFITKWARQKGTSTALKGFCWAGIIMSAAMVVFMLLVDPKQISVGIVPTVIFLLLQIGRTLIIQSNASLTNVMIADCADYETYCSGKFMPGMVGTIYSFTDKLFSSFSNTIVGLALAAIGFKKVLPQVGDPSTTSIFWVTMILGYMLPMIGWICSLIALKFYTLTPEKMVEIQKANAERRKQNAMQ